MEENSNKSMLYMVSGERIIMATGVEDRIKAVGAGPAQVVRALADKAETGGEQNPIDNSWFENTASAAMSEFITHPRAPKWRYPLMIYLVKEVYHHSVCFSNAPSIIQSMFGLCRAIEELQNRGIYWANTVGQLSHDESLDYITVFACLAQKPDIKLCDNEPSKARDIELHKFDHGMGRLIVPAARFFNAHYDEYGIR